MPGKLSGVVSTVEHVSHITGEVGYLLFNPAHVVIHVAVVDLIIALRQITDTLNGAEHDVDRGYHLIVVILNPEVGPVIVTDLLVEDARNGEVQGTKRRVDHRHGVTANLRLTSTIDTYQVQCLARHVIGLTLLANHHELDYPAVVPLVAVHLVDPGAHI